MGLSTEEIAGSESVAELVEEGQFFEAEAVNGMERPYPDEGEMRRPEDDVPREYPTKDSALDTEQRHRITTGKPSSPSVAKPMSSRLPAIACSPFISVVSPGQGLIARGRRLFQQYLPFLRRTRPKSV
jgi:hypothetical protein